MQNITIVMRKLSFKCVCSVMGASASGKSLLLQALSGRVQDLDISGTCFINGQEANPKRLDNPISYVPQDDSVIGELTAREVAMDSALLKRDQPRSQLAKDVDILLGSLGLSKVADGIIGNLIFVSEKNLFKKYATNNH